MRFLVLIVLIVALIIIFSPGQVLPLIARALVVNDPQPKSDAIIVLLGGEVPERVLRASELLKAGVAPRILLGSGYKDKLAVKDAPPQFNWPPVSRRFQLAFESLGVSGEQLTIINTEDAFDTSGELSRVADYCVQESIKSLTLVTSASHSRRVSVIWSRVGKGIPASVVAARPDSLDSWWRKPRAIREVGYEFGALIKEFIRRLF